MITQNRTAKLERIRKLAAGEPEGIQPQTIIIRDGLDPVTEKPPKIEDKPGILSFIVDIISTNRNRPDE